MSVNIRFLEPSHVREAHLTIFQDFGLEVPPLGSLDRLEGALGRVKNAAVYRSTSLVELAVITAVSISQAQAFMDGNKRAAEGAMNAFLRFNGYRFTGNWMQVALFLEINAFLGEVPNRGDEPREKGLQAFTLWLETAVVPRD